MKRLLILSTLFAGLLFSPVYAQEVSKKEINKLMRANPNARGPSEASACPQGFVERWQKIEHSAQIGNPAGQPVQSDFPPAIWQQCANPQSTLGRRNFNNGTGDNSHYDNQVFCDTFNTEPLIRPTRGSCCQMIGARIAAVLKNNNNPNWVRGDNATDDRFADFQGTTITTVSNGDVHSPWSSPPNPQQNWTWWWRWISVANVLDGKYSYIFSDDTDISRSVLYGQYCCPKRLPSDGALNGGLSRQSRPNVNQLLKSITGDLPKAGNTQQMNAVPAQPKQLQQLQPRQLKPQKVQ